jgi:diacylglycerol kinase (ATP)
VKRVKIIVNPNADVGRAVQSAPSLVRIADELGGADWAGTVYPGHGVHLARQAAGQGYELVVAAGGDGTFHEVANGLLHVPRAVRPRLGLVPLGSGNDGAYAVGMSHDPAQALRQVFSGQPKRFDVGRLSDGDGRSEYWINTMGIGFDATGVIRSQRHKRLHGLGLYLVAVLETILFYHEAPQMRVKTESEAWEMAMLMLVLCNGPREGGGFLIQPQARPDDGRLNYAWVGKISRLRMLRLLPEVMRGTHGRFAEVRMGAFERLQLSADRPLRIQTDGEVFAGLDSQVRELTVEVLPGEIEMVI